MGRKPPGALAPPIDVGQRDRMITAASLPARGREERGGRKTVRAENKSSLRRLAVRGRFARAARAVSQALDLLSEDSGSYPKIWGGATGFRCRTVPLDS